MTEAEMIDNIPRFECSDGQPIAFSETFLKQKLHNALVNPKIVNLARGEGRSAVLNDIVFHPEMVIFRGKEESSCCTKNIPDEMCASFLIGVKIYPQRCME